MTFADTRYSLRMIRKTPGASAIAILSLALGIGANTAIFSLVDTMLLKRLPIRSPDEIYIAVNQPPPRSGTSWTYPDYVALRDKNTVFSGLAAAGGMGAIGMQLAESDASTPAELADGMAVSGNYFQVLGVEPAIGRVFNSDEDRAPGASPYVVLSYDYWQSRFRGDPRVLGRKMRLNGYPFSIVGVARRGFRSTDVSVGPSLYYPIMMRSEIMGRPFATWNNRNNQWAMAYGRIKPGANLKQAEAELTVIYKDRELEERRTAVNQRFVNSARPVFLLPAARGYSYVRNRLEQPLLVLMAVVGLVLVIACANVANLMLARGASREREIAVRLAVGASRGRLIRQLLTEGTMLAIAGGIAGLAVAYGGVQVLLQFLPQAGGSAPTLAVAPDFRVIGFTAAVSLLTGLLFSVAPALQSTKPALVTALKENTAGAGLSRFGLRNILVVVQVALSLLLVIGAGLFVRSLGSLGDVDAGFRREHTVIAAIEPGRNGYSGQRLRDFYQRLLASVKRIPGVQSAALANITPLSGSRWNDGFFPEGYEFKQGDERYVDMNAVGPQFFETMGIPLVAGREFRDEDNPATSQPLATTFAPGVRAPVTGPRNVIVNQSFAKKYFAGRNPVGMNVARNEKYDPAEAYEVVGVVQDVHYFGLRQQTQPMMYVAVWRDVASGRALVLRTTSQAVGVPDAVRREVTALDAAVPVLSFRTIEQQIDNNIMEDRLMTTPSGFFGALALLLAAVGLYGVIAYSVSRRTRELGVRTALGAQRSDLVRLVLRHGTRLAIVGVGLGALLAALVGRVFEALLYGVSPLDPLAYALAAAILLLVAAAANLVPALAAARVDPIRALRSE